MTRSETPVAVVTGSASGNGAAIVERLARERRTLVINYRRSAGKALARSEGSSGSRVNRVNPGYVEQRALSDEEKQRAASAVPLLRVGTAAEVAEAVAFLVSERAAYINGAVLNVHGGLWV